VYVCQDIGDLEQHVCLSGTPWKNCVVGGEESDACGWPMASPCTIAGGCADHRIWWDFQMERSGRSFRYKHDPAFIGSAAREVCVANWEHYAAESGDDLAQKLVENRICARSGMQLRCAVLGPMPKSARAFAAWWWARVDNFLRVAGACGNSDDLARHILFGDPVVAKWYQCMSQGLRARRASNARVAAWRVSPVAALIGVLLAIFCQRGRVAVETWVK